ncbi:MAG: PTS sugar transporter subunit IIB [Anaerolineales bacterium]|nr:PTS sugar transporter subunit IIB [Anaerolineales bacterium]MDW8163070.1 PTS sugar transporter subunit IIB [Anaerolineales bacterium]
MNQRVKRILVACGTAIATSTLVAVQIQEEMAKRGLTVETRQCKATEVPSYAQDVDLIVSTTPVPQNLGKPVIQTLAFLTGVGKEEVLSQIEKILKEL